MSSNQGINIPGVLLDELKDQDYSKDERFTQYEKRRKSTNLGSRKKRRKIQRLEKKTQQKNRNQAKQVSINNLKKIQSKDLRIELSQENEKKILKKKISTKKKSVRFGGEEIKEIENNKNIDSDEIGSDEIGSDEIGSDANSDDDFDDDFDDDSEDIELDNSMSVEETMSALKALKKSSAVKKDQLSDEDDQLSDEDDQLSDEENSDEELDNSMSVEQTMEALKALKAKKNSKKFQDIKNNEEEQSEEEKSDDELDDDELDDDELDASMSVEQTMDALKALKEKKNSNKLQDEEKIKPKKKKSSKKQIEEEPAIIPMSREDIVAIERDEMDMKYYAKKLGLKKSSKKIHAKNEFDAIGGLLEGLDYFENFGNDDEDYGDFAHDNQKTYQEEKLDSNASGNEDEDDNKDEDELISEDNSSNESNEEVIENPFSSDDELDSDDFDEFNEEDLDSDEWEQLRELEGDKSSKKSTERENPYMAPVENTSYIPPSMRKTPLVENDSQIMQEIKKKVKSALNKLSESNILIIISSLNDLYDSNPRQYVTKAIIDQILEIIVQSNKLLDSFIMVYSAVMYSLWKLKGIEVGASFIQSTVEIFLINFNNQLDITNSEEKLENPSNDQEEHIIIPKQCSNIITLISYCYNFGLISCKLIYNLISELIKTPNEFTTELLLKIVSVSGQLIRGDDPTALKDILSELLTNVKTINNKSPRLKFLLDTLSDLKNNRLKPSILATSNQQLKKIIQGSVKSSGFLEPLQVSLDDIKNVETKGKWWLVGASWRGNMDNAFEEAESQSNNNSTALSDNITLDDSLLDEIPDWMAISKKQRMNTDIRRAIFISIMSANDYMDAFTKLEKLGLKNKQMLEIPKVLLHCLVTDGNSNGYNPYYSLVASKLAEHHSQLQKPFQFLFWDIIKKLEDKMNIESDSEVELDDDSDLNEDERLKKISNQGSFFGSLISEGILKFESFKHVPIMSGLTTEGLLFVQVLLFQFFLAEGKKAEIKGKKNSSGKREYTYKATGLTKHLEGIKLDNKVTILKGLKWFTTKKFKYKPFIKGSPNSKEYIRENRRLDWAVHEFVSQIEASLDIIDI
ncbi:hypothetical protein TBLA_0G01270 [Henningerozyma blattae CBS 6284]|uniref:MI domain-containing protein n=1 Tax=Henningerozyma blattae (strain ATCC 34711 / CBS 6284 / DSM 70876 / NBRC 10599 / NRRL Y-10934 / UCD 77-7) TaxID=1071380 RepID=I2H6S2_HENB6|nr:hypothetical protein TBLA_0G01270 [Tetrapisispora blattae CBS 6284]CCH62074.1 hypothetical protein TBLA_0G01270 [Tetrapisispora blattae CBS 6284]